MEILNIGPLELVFILIIALVVLGPEQMIKTGRDLARGIRKIVRSPIWKSLMDTSHEIKDLPRKFIREAGIEESLEEINRLNRFPEEGRRIVPHSSMDKIETPQEISDAPDDEEKAVE